MLSCEYDGSVFLTSIVAYILGNFPVESTAQEGKEKALAFLSGEMEPDATWSYYTHANKEKLPPDFDEIANISAVLTLSGRSFPSNLGVIERYRNESGTLPTFLTSRPAARADCEVNANVLFYFAVLAREDMPICGYLNRVIATGDTGCCEFCPFAEQTSFLPVYYLMARAYHEQLRTLGHSCLDASRQTIVRIVREIHAANALVSDMDRALAATTLLRLGYTGVEVDALVEQLLEDQHADGLWDMAGFYRNRKATHYGAAELTTAFAIEAIASHPSGGAR